MAKGKSHKVSVEIELLREQFDKDFRQAGRDVANMQKELTRTMEQNKIKFQFDKLDPGAAEKLFSGTVVGRIFEARKQTEFLNQQLSFQKNKLDIARAAWESTTASKAATASAIAKAEAALLREQKALLAVRKELDATASTSQIAGDMIKKSALATAAAIAALAAAYASAVKSAVSWGQAVNDIVDETGMADASAARLLGVMNIVGLSSEEAAGAMAKLAKNVAAADKEQRAAAKSGKDAEDVFTKYGIKITDTNGVLLGHEEIIHKIMAVHSEMADGLEKTAMEMELFGKTGYKMNDLLNLSKEQFDEYAKQIDKFGLSIKDSQKYENFNRELNKMQLALKGIAVTITEDNIPAISSYIGKLSEFAGWLRANKDALSAIDQETLRGFSAVFYPVTQSVELAVSALKKYVEARQQAVSAQKAPEADSTLDDVRAAAKMAEEAAKKQADAARQKAALDKQLKESNRDLQMSMMQLQEKTLQATLLGIEKERQEWANKVKDEVKATEWAEAAKTKAIKDEVNRRLGEEVAAAKKAILEGGDVTSAIAKASEARKKDEQATYEAQKAVRDYYGIKAPGDTQTKVIVDLVKGLVTSVKEVVKELIIPKDRNGQTVLDPYKPAPGKAIEITLNNQFTITVDPATPNLFADVAQKAAGMIDQQVRERLNKLPTGY